MQNCSSRRAGGSAPLATAGGAAAAAVLLMLLAGALFSSSSLASDTAALTLEQRKMQAYAKRQYDRGRMAMARGNKEEAKDHYREAIKTYEKYFGKADERLVEPLAAYAQTYADLWQEPKKKQRSVLERLLQLYDDLGKSGHERAAVMAQLGDWWVTKENEERSTDYYRRAWQAVADERGAEQANREFQKARTLYFKPPVYRPKDLGGRASTTVMSFTIARSGRVEDVRIVESDSRAELTAALNKALRARRYRPPVVDGEPLEVADLKMSFSFPKEGGIPVEDLVP